jgi:PAT family beta-lactamase induction signal transducer AmpG
MPDWTRNVDTIVRAYFNRRMAVLLALGFASGVPLALTGNTLQAWMKDRNVDLSTIGLFGLLSFPYLLKFLWAPLMDRYVPPLLGRRRGWILVTQLLLIIAISLMAFAGNQSSLIPLAILSLAVAFFSASQDIAFDAYRVDLLPDAERGAGAAITVAGYRIAMIVLVRHLFPECRRDAGRCRCHDSRPGGNGHRGPAADTGGCGH